MRFVKWTAIGLVIGLVLFTFIPTSHSSQDVISGFIGLGSYDNAVAISQTQLVVPYIDEYPLEDNTELVPVQSSTVVAQSGYLFCDKDGNGIDGSVSSYISGNRAGSLHNGEDIVPVGDYSSYGPNEVFAVCPLPGTVVSAGYDTANQRSMGYNVIVKITDHVSIVYMHLGYGSGRAVQFSSYTTPEALIAKYPFQNVGYPNEWMTEQDFCTANGAKWQGVSRWVGPSSIQVKAGDVLEAGAIVGVPGNTGNSTGLHAHFTLRYTDDSGTKYYGSISELLSGTNMKDLKWLSQYGSGPKTAAEWGWNTAELDIQVQKDGGKS